MSAANDRQPIRVAIVGCGFIARSHCQRLKSDARVRLAAFCDPHLASAARLRDEFAADAIATAQLDEAFALPGLTDEERKKVLSSNAAQLYRIPLPGAVKN